MFVVLDPNVLVSAALSPAGAPAELVRRWLAGDFELLVSVALLSELRRVMAYPKIAKRVTSADASAFLELLAGEAHMRADPESQRSIKVEDPGDEYLVALAMEYRAALVSGDQHLAALADRLPIFNPREFLLRLDIV